MSWVGCVSGKEGKGRETEVRVREAGGLTMRERAEAENEQTEDGAGNQ